MKVIFLDLATSTGWAVGTVSGVEEFGTIVLPKTGVDVGLYLNVADSMIDRLVGKHLPTVLAFEAPWLSRRDRIENTRKLHGLPNVVEQIASRRKLECVEASVHDVAEHFLGVPYPKGGDRKKMATRVKCRDLGFEVRNSDEADALAGLSYILSCKHPLKALETVPMAKFLMPVQ